MLGKQRIGLRACTCAPFIAVKLMQVKLGGALRTARRPFATIRLGIRRPASLMNRRGYRPVRGRSRG